MKEYVTIEDIERAWRECKRRKGSSWGQVEYSRDWLTNNVELWRDLNNMTYEIGESRAFCVTRPKLREVFCAQFRDRIVHHLAVGKFLDIFEAEMSDNACACRKGKGTLYGIRRLRDDIERVTENYTKEAWILKGDLQGFFMSIGRQQLWGVVERLIREKYAGEDMEWWLWLWKKLILNAPEKNCVKVGDLSLWEKLPRDKSLFTSGGKGLPIGNLPSQILANLLLSPFDKWMEARLLPEGGYSRYVDDFVCVHRDKKLLLNLYEGARAYLKDSLGLRLHPKKFYLQQARKGVSFVGATIKPHRLLASRRTVKNTFEKIELYNEDKIGIDDFANSYNSYIGHVRHFDSYGLRRRAWRAINNYDGLCCVNMKKIIRLNNIENIIKRKETA